MSRLCRSTCSFLLLACLTAHLQAQPVVQRGEVPVAIGATQARFEHLTAADGLPENSVWTLLQDHLGFIWIGTGDGLARYDGLTMTVFQDDPDDPFSFLGTRVITLMEDRAGDLWIGTAKTGLTHYDRASGRFTTYANDPADPNSLSNNNVQAIYEDQRGDLWVVTDSESDNLDRDNLDRFNRATGTFTRFRHDPDDPGSLGSDTVDGESSDTVARRFAFYEDRSGTIWVGTEGGGLNRFAMMQHASGGTGQREPTDINALVSEHIDLAYHGKRAQVPELQVEIERDLGSDVGKVEIVPQEIGRVLLNLLGNAFDAVQGMENPKVTVTTRQGDGQVEIRVADNGPGIPRDIKAKIFEPFFTTKPTGSGTGLGLSLSYDIVTQGHGGTLTVESEEGHGAVFVIILSKKSELHESNA